MKAAVSYKPPLAYPKMKSQPGSEEDDNVFKVNYSKSSRFAPSAGMAELADAADSKSAGA